jgi:hypothetical protein
VQGTALLARTIAALRVPPRIWLSGSAIGVYGSRGNEVLSEASAPGDDYLADVCRQWERATAPAESARVSVTHLRTGLVLAKNGGVLARLRTPFGLGIGGKISSGTQWMSWIGLHDYVRAVAFLLARPLAGAVNMTAPAPVTNAAFTRSLGAALSRPAVLPVPAFALRAVFGEMADETLLASQRALPERLLRAGFTFDEPDLPAALRRELA